MRIGYGVAEGKRLRGRGLSDTSSHIVNMRRIDRCQDTVTQDCESEGLTGACLRRRFRISNTASSRYLVHSDLTWVRQGYRVLFRGVAVVIQAGGHEIGPIPSIVIA